MSFMRPKMPAMPPTPTRDLKKETAEADAIAKEKNDAAAVAAQDADIKNQRERREAATDVGGRKARSEEQAEEGLLKSTRRRSISRAMYGG